MGVWCNKGVVRLVFRSVFLVFVTWNGCLVLQRCWKTGVLVGFLGVCDMKWVFGVTKVLEDWCLVGLSGVCDMKWVFGVTKVFEYWCFGRFVWCL